MKKGLIFLCLVTLFSCSPANIYITGTEREPIPIENVVVYNEQTLPDEYEIIGDANVQSEGNKSAQRRNLKKLKEVAAGVGANGLILGQIQYSGHNNVALRATAIYVDK